MSIHLYFRNGRLTPISDDMADAVEILRRLPRCCREMKYCPATGCNCQGQIEERASATPSDQQDEKPA